MVGQSAQRMDVPEVSVRAGKCLRGVVTIGETPSVKTEEIGQDEVWQTSPHYS